MYICRNCGKPYVAEEAIMCVQCRAPRGAGNQFCPCCGNQVPPNAVVCMQCGVDMSQYGSTYSGKSKVAAGLLGIFLGCYGVHNFYLGYTKKAIVQLSIILLAIVSIFIFAFAVTGMESNISDGGAIALIIWYIIEFVAIIGVQIWGFIEGILILCGKIKRDGKGALLK